jgi:hypothetical protein
MSGVYQKPGSRRDRGFAMQTQGAIQAPSGVRERDAVMLGATRGSWTPNVDLEDPHMHETTEPTRHEPEVPVGEGPLADAEPDTGRPIDDPALADNANPRWVDPTAPQPDAQPLANPDGTPNVMPSGHAEMPIPMPSEHAGTAQDQAARPIEPEIGRDNIAQGLGGGAPNPALAEGGEAGEGS